MGPIHAVWTPRDRLLSLRFERGCRLDEPWGTRLAELIDEVAGPQRERVALLVDASGVEGVAAAYRAQQSRYMSEHSDHVRVAIFNVNAFTRVIVNLVIMGSRADMRLFGDRKEALTWLGQAPRVIPA